MARVRSTVERAASLHRQAVATVDAAERALENLAPQRAPEVFTIRQSRLAASLTEITSRAAPGWLGLPITDELRSQPTGTFAEALVPVRIGTASPVADAAFPVVVPLLGAGHLSLAGTSDPRTAGLLRSVLLRLIAATTPGSLRVRTVDPSGSVFEAFDALFDGRLMPPPVTDRAGLRAVLAEAEQWVRSPAPPGRQLVVVLAALPARADATDVARIKALADQGAESRISVIAVGDIELSHATRVTYDDGEPRIGALDLPTVLDPDPPAEIIEAICDGVAALARAADALTLRDLLPAEIWHQSSAAGLSTTVGVAGLTPLPLRLNDLTPHWLVGGRHGAGKTSFLTNVLFGLCASYAPEELSLYLLDFKRGAAFRDFTPSDREPTWIPHTRVVGAEVDRAYGLAVLRELDRELNERAELFEKADVLRFADYRSTTRMPRIVCLLEEFPLLLAGDDRIASDAATLLDGLARRGRGYGIHLILSASTTTGIGSLAAKRDSVFGQFPVRIALPGGSEVLDVQNSSADQLRLGTAIVNMAGGLGGPAGASRAHERLVDFPDPGAEAKTLSSARRKLWLARPAGSQAPYVFQGSAPAHPPKRIPRSRRPSAYLGHAFDVELSPVTFAFEAKPGRHLAIIGPSEMGATMLDAATRSVAAQHKPGSVRFVLSALVPAGEDVTVTLAADLSEAGHTVEVVEITALRSILGDPSTHDTYIVGFGLDGTGSVLHRALREGPSARTHLMGWWRGLRRFQDDIGGPAGQADVAGLVLLNVPAGDVSKLLDEPELDWQPRTNRALVHDRHDARTQVIVPYMRRSTQ